MAQDTPPFVSRLENLDEVGRIEWRPATGPDPGNPNEQQFDALFITPRGDGPSYDRAELEDAVNAVTSELRSSEFQIDTTMYYDDGIELRNE